MAKTDTASAYTVILDAGPVIHLDELGCLSLLSDFQELIVPSAVWEEIEHHRPSALSTAHVSLVKQRVPAPTSALFALCEAFNLNRGEREALSFCFGRPRSVLFTDDAAVRLAAKAAGIRAYGTLGVLIRAIRRKQLTPEAVVRLLEQIPERSTLFIRKSLLREIIEKIKSEYGIK